MGCDSPGVNLNSAEMAAATSFVPEVGDRVRIVLEGELRTAGSDFGFYLSVGGGSLVYVPHAVMGRSSVEKLPDPEPTFQEGDYVIAPDGHVLERLDGVWRNTRGSIITDSMVWRPLRLLVRGGESVAAGGGNG